MEIAFHGNSHFTLKGKNGSLETNPNNSTLDTKSNVVTFSEMTEDTTIQNTSETKTIYRPGEYEVVSIMVKALQARLDDPKTGEKNIIYSITVDDVNLCHLGKLNRALTPAEINELGEINVLLIPVGGEGTLTSGDAAKTISALSPKLVVPMSYADNDISKSTAMKDEKEITVVDVPSLKAFLGEMGVDKVSAQKTLSVTPNNQPLTTEVVILDIN
ncbi:MAG: MBL fold metallo-hydrolase [Dehalococcoidia bacterium]